MPDLVPPLRRVDGHRVTPLSTPRLTPLRLLLPVLLALVALLGPAPSAAASPGTVAADLRTRINAALGRSTAASFSRPRSH